jgi:hypothetical protein
MDDFSKADRTEANQASKVQKRRFFTEGEPEGEPEVDPEVEVEPELETEAEPESPPEAEPMESRTDEVEEDVRKIDVEANVHYEVEERPMQHDKLIAEGI